MNTQKSKQKIVKRSKGNKTKSNTLIQSTKHQQNPFTDSFQAKCRV